MSRSVKVRGVRTRTPLSLLATLALAGAWQPAAAQRPEPGPTAAAAASPPVYRERPDGPYVAVPRAGQATSPAPPRRRGPYVSIQVNVDAEGNNIVGDAANEPSIAVDPTDPQRIAIGWRQFDTIGNSFRQAGWAHSDDGGASWTFPGVLEPGIFRSDPVLTFDTAGNFYYYSLQVPGGSFNCDTFKSADGGASWGAAVFAFGGDKAWITADRTGGAGDGQLYAAWSQIGCCGSNSFNRSVDGGASFEAPVPIPGEPIWGVPAVGPDGEVYVAGRPGSTSSQFVVARSSTAQDPGSSVTFELSTAVDLGGTHRSSAGPNPGGLLGQVWVAVDSSDGPRRGHVYLLSSVDPPGSDPLDVHFARSMDGGLTWSSPVRVNGDPGNAAWQWFGTMAVAPDGRIDVVWNDTRADPGGFDSELYSASSADGGASWTESGPLSPPFDPHLGWPQQNKIGDYYDMVADAAGFHLAYAATFNGEQDVYYLRLMAPLFSDGFESGGTGAWSQTTGRAPAAAR